MSSSIRKIFWAAALAVSLATPALAWQGEAKKAEDRTQSGTAEKKNDQPKAEIRPMAPVDPDYVIGVEDVLAVNVWREPEMSRVVIVRPDGKITLPLLGEFEADGMTPKKLEAVITKKLETLVTNPDVSVIVQEIRSRKFNVIGEVARPGSYPLTNNMTVLDAIALAGGFKDFARPKKMYVLRQHKDSTVRISVNYPKVLKGEAPQQNLRLEARDTIVVP